MIKKLLAGILGLSLLVGVGVRAGQDPSKLSLEIPVYIHSKCTTAPTEQQIVKQMDVLNAAYAKSTPFKFVFKGHNFTPEWQGGPTALNLYAVHLEEFGYEGTLGLSSEGAKVVVDCNTLPGGKFRLFSKGYTAVHEVGHYLGLHHVSDTCSQEFQCNWMDTQLADMTDTGSFTEQQVDQMVTSRIKLLISAAGPVDKH